MISLKVRLLIIRYSMRVSKKSSSSYSFLFLLVIFNKIIFINSTNKGQTTCPKIIINNSFLSMQVSPPSGDNLYDIFSYNMSQTNPCYFSIFVCILMYYCVYIFLYFSILLFLYLCVII